MSLSLIKKYLIDTLTTELAPVAVKWTGGSFGSDDLKRFLTTSPTVMVSILGINDWKKVQVPGKFRCNAVGQFGIYLLARGENRDSETLDLVASMLTIAPGLTGTGDTFRIFSPTEPTAQNLYSGQIDGLAVALWGVQWDASISLISEES